MSKADPLDRAVRSSMTEVLSALAPDTCVAAAARLFHEQHLSGAPVVDERGHLVGVVSQTDLVDAPRGGVVGVAHYYLVHGGKTLTSSIIPGAEAASGVVGDCMRRDVQTVSPGSPLRDAVRVMVTHEIHRVLVVDAGRLVGLVSTMDVLRALMADRPEPDDQGF
jgi:CBS domain-containing protein